MSNPFQLVIVQDIRHYQAYMMFIYGDDLRVARPSPTGDIIITAGYDADDGHNFANIPGSWTMEINGVAETSNVGIPGMWIFNCDGKPYR